MSSIFREIAPLRLDQYETPNIEGNRGLVWRCAWYLTSALFFQGTLLALIPSSTKAAILRVFGAKVGEGLVCKPRVCLKYPWFMELGDDVWLGENVWIDNHCPVKIGSSVCISQGAYIFTGNHDWNDSKFAFFCKPVSIGDGAWVTARQVVNPGTTIPPNHAMLSES